MTAPRGLGRGRGDGGSGGWLLSFPSGSEERVILSAAGAKDLLVGREADPSLARVPRARSG